jgi:O-antigen/teichoic acid export membrane protein
MLCLNKPEDRRLRHVTYILLGIINVIIPPVFVLLSTPIIIINFGNEGLGIWLILMAVSSLGFLLNIGISDASLQYIGKNLNNNKNIIKYLWKIISISIFIIFVITPFLLNYFDDLLTKTDIIISKLCVISIVSKLALDQIDLQFGAILKAGGNFRSNLIVDIFFKINIYAFGLYGLYSVNSLEVFFYVALLFTILKIIVKSKVVKRVDNFSDSIESADFSFSSKQFSMVATGFFIMAFNGYTLSLLERILLPGIFDLGVLGQLAIATQVTFFIHSLPAAGMSFLLPIFSSSRQDFSLVYAFLINIFLSIIMVIIVYLFVQYGMVYWLKSDYLLISDIIFSLSAPMFFYSLCIVPYYSLMAGKKGLNLSLMIFFISSLFIIFMLVSREYSLFLESFIYVKSVFIYFSGLVIYGYFFYTKIKEKKYCSSSS